MSRRIVLELTEAEARALSLVADNGSGAGDIEVLESVCVTDGSRRAFFRAYGKLTAAARTFNHYQNECDRALWKS